MQLLQLNLYTRLFLITVHNCILQFLNSGPPIAVGDHIFWGMQDFDFAQIQSSLPKSNQLFPNVINFAQKNFARRCSYTPSSYDTDRSSCSLIGIIKNLYMQYDKRITILHSNASNHLKYSY